ncbi:beta-lactamase superfamily domain protein [Cystoisospora suis]|uniref:Beta-lactamase superfamily domain protein n=1 Tax=Cystoisospora suis TaxID=483139 RepID=A0A2C6KV37_9APIC|nr:beta-lactamase superfamily domain protein [Cystoisospora suis]
MTNRHPIHSFRLPSSFFFSSSSSSSSLPSFSFSVFLLPKRHFSTSSRGSPRRSFSPPPPSSSSLHDKWTFLSSLPRSFLRLFFFHFDPPASSPYSSPRFTSRREFLRYRLLQWHQHLRQKKLENLCVQTPKEERDTFATTTNKKKIKNSSGRSKHPRQEEGEEVREDSVKRREKKSSSFLSLLPGSFSLHFRSSSFSSSFFDPRWRSPSLWPVSQPFPSARPPPEYVTDQTHDETHASSSLREETKRKKDQSSSSSSSPSISFSSSSSLREDKETEKEESSSSSLSSSISFSSPSSSSSSSMPLRVECIGHGTFLLQCDGVNVLTDPIFSYKAGPYGYLGVPRISRPGVSLEDLPPIDVVLISSTRYDAYDYLTLKHLAKKHGSTFFIPQGAYCRRYLSPSLFGNVYPMNWADRVKFGRNLLIFFSPSLHKSTGRYGLDFNMPGWGSYVLTWMKGSSSPTEDGRREGEEEVEKKVVYFGGKSAYSRKMFRLIRDSAWNDLETFRGEVKEEEMYQRHLEEIRRRRRRDEACREEEEEILYLIEGGEEKKKKEEETNMKKRRHEERRRKGEEDTDEVERKREKKTQGLKEESEQEEEEEKKDTDGDDFVFDLSILPIGGYEPRQYMYRYQMSPHEAVDAHLDLTSRLSIASYYDVFPIGSEDFGEASERLKEACQLKKVEIFDDIHDLCMRQKQSDVFSTEKELTKEKNSLSSSSSPETSGGRFLLLNPGTHIYI